jgi:hypothetical protein
MSNGEELWIYRISANTDTFPIASKHGEMITHNWSEIELVSDPSVLGWVWNASKQQR